MGRSTFVAIGLAALALVATREAQAFCRSTTCRGGACTTDDDGCPNSGKPLYWATSCIGISLQQRLTQNLPHPEVRIALQRAMQAWSEVDCGGGKLSSLTFSVLQDVACNRSEYKKDGPNVNVVTFKDDDWTYKDEDNTLAKTSVTFNVETGEILDADIEVNTASNALTVSASKAQYDLQSIMTHEFGHLIGLAHSPFPTATMFASYDKGSTELRTLSTDDVAAACAVYPPGRSAVCNPTPRGGLGTTCAVEEAAKKGCSYGAGGVDGGVLAAGSALFILTARRVRIRRRR